MNISNKLTILRIVLTFICIGLILKNDLAGLCWAALVFLLASLTDFLDGFLARRKKLTSDFGRLMDPIADKILIVGVFCAFLQLGVINAWMVSLIMLREFIVTGMRLYGLNKGIVLEAKKLGKHKTFSQIIGICVIFFTLILSKFLPSSRGVYFLYHRFIPIIMWYIVIITLFSGIYYFWVNRKAIKTF
ncbi:MAG: CDP-diacylglycerol--glycerol-3-phosphate 3-phosphatidyltransferase [Candidatus Omnitrophica bacterium]|nr:CDP-diacylglycerol--glycerol-3-phosphate 3-phosphatidyltransferase [Candidatus Omnitrophota bacterium]MBD3269268.1 CDP-diacylglycerol--glycerol-3-phosphate 3-phosphatidyltransferase [Candidatus Omnitrophota bacterium]